MMNGKLLLENDPACKLIASCTKCAPAPTPSSQISWEGCSSSAKAIAMEGCEIPTKTIDQLLGYLQQS